MTCLIGAGSHARDIRATMNFTDYCAHHEGWDGSQPVLIGVNSPQQRAWIASQLDVHDLAWVHPHTFIGPDCNWLPGTHINYGVTMTRTRIGRHCTISPGATICGDVTIGDRVLVGAGATICDRVTIHDDVVIGAGAVVLPETVIRRGIWVGVPARPTHREEISVIGYPQ